VIVVGSTRSTRSSSWLVYPSSRTTSSKNGSVERLVRCSAHSIIKTTVSVVLSCTPVDLLETRVSVPINSVVGVDVVWVVIVTQIKLMDSRLRLLLHPKEHLAVTYSVTLRLNCRRVATILFVVRLRGINLLSTVLSIAVYFPLVIEVWIAIEVRVLATVCRGCYRVLPVMRSLVFLVFAERLAVVPDAMVLLLVVVRSPVKITWGNCELFHIHLIAPLLAAALCMPTRQTVVLGLRQLRSVAQVLVILPCHTITATVGSKSLSCDLVSSVGVNLRWVLHLVDVALLLRPLLGANLGRSLTVLSRSVHIWLQLLHDALSLDTALLLLLVEEDSLLARERGHYYRATLNLWLILSKQLVCYVSVILNCWLLLLLILPRTLIEEPFLSCSGCVSHYSFEARSRLHPWGVLLFLIISVVLLLVCFVFAQSVDSLFFNLARLLASTPRALRRPRRYALSLMVRVLIIYNPIGKICNLCLVQALALSIPVWALVFLFLFLLHMIEVLVWYLLIHALFESVESFAWLCVLAL